MSKKRLYPIVEDLRREFRNIVEKEDIADKKISIVARPLSPEEAIGRTGRKDYPLITGKERLIEARYRGSIGHAFTDMPGDCSSTIEEILALELTDNAKRAFFIASLNAVYNHLFPDQASGVPVRWLQHVAQDLRTGPTSLLPFSPDLRGRPAQQSRGSGATWNTFFLLQIDETFAREHFAHEFFFFLTALGEADLLGLIENIDDLLFCRKTEGT